MFPETAEPKIWQPDRHLFLPDWREPRQPRFRAPPRMSSSCCPCSVCDSCCVTGTGSLHVTFDTLASCSPISGNTYEMTSSPNAAFCYRYSMSANLSGPVSVNLGTNCAVIDILAICDTSGGWTLFMTKGGTTILTGPATSFNCGPFSFTFSATIAAGCGSCTGTVSGTVTL